MILTLARFVKGVLTGGKDRDSFRHGMGWWSPEMRQHFRTLREEGRWHHDFINLFTEWTRLDPQRAAKASLDIISWLILSLILLARS